MDMETKLRLMKSYPPLRFKAAEQFQFAEEAEEDIEFLIEVVPLAAPFVALAQEAAATGNDELLVAAVEVAYTAGLVRGWGDLGVMERRLAELKRKIEHAA